MSQKTYLHIKEPCHENWEAMSPVAQGRFCEGCAKQVIDFSRMSDAQILDVLSKATGKTCGRFSGSQLERPVVQEIPYFLKPYKIVLSSLVPVFILAVNASGQENKPKGEVTTHTKVIAKKIQLSDKSKALDRYPAMMGMITLRTTDTQQQLQEFKPLKNSIAKSKVDNKNDEHIPHATGVKGPHKKNDADDMRKSSLKPAQVNTVIIATPIVDQNKTAKPDYDKEYLHNTLEPVTVTCFGRHSCTAMAGGISIVKTVTSVDTARTFVQKLFNNDMFKAFPNPAPKGQTVHLSFRKEGDYMIQLFDNSGRLYIEKQVLLSGKEMISRLAMPVTISSGVYYLKAVNTSTRKNFIEKILVE